MASAPPKRRMDVHQNRSDRTVGKRVGTRRNARRRSLRISPAMVGTFTLIVAAFGSAIIGNQPDGTPLSTSSYQPVPETTPIGSEVGGVEVSRDFDRNLDKQGQAQAAQMLAAQADLSKKIGTYSAELKKNQWVLPVTGYFISTRFGQRGSRWSSGRHTGVDMAGRSGSTIVALAAGTVKSAGYDGAYGNRTVITLLDGTEIWYCHQSRIVVKPGDKVLPGQITGYTGSTGNSSGPHLHLEIIPAGSGHSVDPVSFALRHSLRL